MGKPNHGSLKYKKEHAPNRVYKDLKQKQKARISEWMFREVSLFYAAHQAMPAKEEAVQMIVRVYHKIESAAIWVPYESVYEVLMSKLPRYEVRLLQEGLPEQRAEEKQPRMQDTGKKKKKKARRKNVDRHTAGVRSDQDDHFFFIAGYTSGGAPYGVTWEEMGLYPYQEPYEEENDAYDPF